MTGVGQPLKTGATLSLTDMICPQVDELPALSLTVQVRVMTLLQEEPGRLCTSLKLGVSVPSTLSVAVTLAGAGTSE